MLAALAIGSGIALSAASLCSRVLYKRDLPLVDQLYGSQSNIAIEADSPDASTALTRFEYTEEDKLREVLVISLTSATAILHLTLGTKLFVLNGVGYAGLLALHYLAPQSETYRQYTRSALFGYTGVTTLGYFIVNGVGSFTNPVGIANKLIELGLLAVLWQDQKEASRSAQVETVQQIPIAVIGGV